MHCYSKNRYLSLSIHKTFFDKNCAFHWDFITTFLLIKLQKNLRDMVHSCNKMVEMTLVCHFEEKCCYSLSASLKFILQKCSRLSNSNSFVFPSLVELFGKTWQMSVLVAMFEKNAPYKYKKMILILNVSIFTFMPLEFPFIFRYSELDFRLHQKNSHQRAGHWCVSTVPDSWDETKVFLGFRSWTQGFKKREHLSLKNQIQCYLDTKSMQLISLNICSPLFFC